MNTEDPASPVPPPAEEPAGPFTLPADAEAAVRRAFSADSSVSVPDPIEATTVSGSFTVPDDVPVGSGHPAAQNANIYGRGPIVPAEPKRIVRNMARCNKCGDVVESKHRHDFVSCTCGQMSVDGGHEYLRRLYGAEGFTEMSEHEA